MWKNLLILTIFIKFLSNKIFRQILWKSHYCSKLQKQPAINDTCSGTSLDWDIFCFGSFCVYSPKYARDSKTPAGHPPPLLLTTISSFKWANGKLRLLNLDLQVSASLKLSSFFLILESSPWPKFGKVHYDLDCEHWTQKSKNLFIYFHPY